MKAYKVVDSSNNVRWYNEAGQLHRVDGPAVEYAAGHKSWWLNGKFHREDGPAYEYANGDRSWYLQGKWIDCSSQEEFERILKLKAFW